MQDLFVQETQLPEQRTVNADLEYSDEDVERVYAVLEDSTPACATVWSAQTHSDQSARWGFENHWERPGLLNKEEFGREGLVHE